MPKHCKKNLCLTATCRTGDTDQPLLGPNQGQYATLSKGCKTLQNDDFY